MYIGKQPVVGNFQVCDSISVVNGQAAYTMQVGGSNVEPESANHMLVSLNGILQAPTSSFTISGATITFASNLATGDSIDFIILLGNVLDIGVPSDGTVTNAKLAQDIISGETALSSEPASTDELLLSDAGTLKRIDYSLIRPSNSFLVSKTSDQSISTGTATKITFDSEDFDTGSNFASDKYTAPSDGKYFFYTKLLSDCTSGETVYVYFRKNGSVIVEHRNTAHGANRRTFSLSAILDLSASDYIEVYKYQGGGSSRDIDGDSNRSTYFMGYKLG